MLHRQILLWQTHNHKNMASHKNKGNFAYNSENNKLHWHSILWQAQVLNRSSSEIYSSSSFGLWQFEKRTAHDEE